MSVEAVRAHFRKWNIEDRIQNLMCPVPVEKGLRRCTAKKEDCKTLAFLVNDAAIWS